ncbi:RNA polymerase sigma factor [Nonomuraea jiangxiensis]|uniref:DNA-directed RNA polymerase specialized sigma subunit, sigma24 family n=1 Tax=Nonomuraea jiangxiensis TaxID=633440 RepID=A0A1G9KHS2_9ACTN|nr:sigma-70 family RNA polymerase sigma factor [Nonomuraea jiangxiensis]SDL49179.1 DNA-directed RNA polymerase specialized sigma subunit, sigma24 family [Nonomuraea jiangxiensis]
MSQPLTGQRPRAELVAELYDRHAAGLFAYCADQLGDPGSASDVLLAVLTGVPDAEPPRAALYALARREIHRRDIVYSPPTVDPLTDPASALVERTLRELRPHQREVLVLCTVCGLSMAELAWVLDVAPDTAEELVVGAAHRFRQSLGMALLGLGARVDRSAEDVYGALGIAPLRDVLCRLPWPEPPGGLRIHFAGSRTASPGPLFVKPRWPGPPVWPQPLAEADPATSTVIFPTELLTPPSPSRAREHEATTAPMPKLRDPLGALDAAAFFPGSPVPGERPFFLAAPTGPEPFVTGDVILPGDADEPFATGDVLLPRNPPPPSAIEDVLVHKGPARPFDPAPAREDRLRSQPVESQPAETRWTGAQRRLPRWTGAQRSEDAGRVAAPLFQPRSRPAEPRPLTDPAAPLFGAKPPEPVYRLPQPEDELSGTGPQPSVRDLGAVPEPSPRPDVPAGDAPVSALRSEAPFPLRREASLLAPRPVRARPQTKRKPEITARPPKARRRRERHHDWAWELIGFLVCVAIAMIVFFSVPQFLGP